MKFDSDLEKFGRLIEALEPWLDEIVIIGGWAQRLYRLDPRARAVDYVPLATLDSDIAIPLKMSAKGENVRERLIAAGFKEERVGEDRPPATHYHFGSGGGFYAEFLTPLFGSERHRNGKRKATREVGGISLQQLRYVDILLLSPWKVTLHKAAGYPFENAKQVQITNPVTFLMQKILIQNVRDRKDRAKDALYIHDTIEIFAPILSELHAAFTDEVSPKVHPNWVTEIKKAPDILFGSVNDTVREAVLMAAGRLSAGALVETCRAGLKAIFV